MKVNAWDQIEKLFDPIGRHCQDCQYRSVTKEAHPYGDTVAYETFEECVLGGRSSDEPMDCPALVSWMDDNEVKEDDLT